MCACVSMPHTCLMIERARFFLLLFHIRISPASSMPTRREGAPAKESESGARAAAAVVLLLLVVQP